LLYHIPYYTTLAGALAVTQAIRALRAGGLKVAPLQSYVGRPPSDLAETA
jgi:carbamoyl-phosphate synthase large subunit